MNIAYFLANSSGKYPDKPAIISENKRLTYKTFNERANHLAHAMISLGLSKGDRVALMFFNTPHFAEVYFATLKAGAVAVPVNFRFVGGEIRFVLNNSKASFFFFGSEFHEKVADIQNELETVNHFIQVDAGKEKFCLDYESLLLSGHRDEINQPMSEHDSCQIMYTSGTTGKPKGAILTHANVYWNLMNNIYLREHRQGEVSLIIGPLYHTAALNNHFTTQVALGGTSILIKKFTPESVLKSIEREKATVISGSPSMFNLLMLYPEIDRFDRRSITKCTSGSSALPREIKERLIEIFPNAGGVYDLYGCTEASPTITTLGAKDSLEKHGSVGLPGPYLQVRVVDEKGNLLSTDSIGELICKGPNVMKGYYGDTEATKKTIRGGWLFTGDLGKVDEKGYFYVVDRKKDMIVSGGENIYPREIEEVLFSHPKIVDAAVVGVPHSVWGETVKAFAVLSEGESSNEDEIIDFCKNYLAGYKKPTSVEFVKSIPKNPSGKVLKRLLRKQPEEA